MSNFVKISEAASLGLHAMALLARAPASRFTNQQIADELEASSHHLAKVMQRLVRARLVNSTRGPLGGFLLAKPDAETSLLEIYEAIEGPIGKPGCLSQSSACGGSKCILGQAIRSLHDQLCDYLKKTTLAELAGNLGPLIALDGQETNTTESQDDSTVTQD